MNEREDEILFKLFGISGYDCSANPNCDSIGNSGCFDVYNTTTNEDNNVV